MTSALCFAALFCSSVELFRQIAVFSVTGLLLALLLALYVFPPYWENLPPAPGAVRSFAVPALSKKAAVAACACLFAFGAWGVTHAHFSGNVEDLNSVSAGFAREKAAFDEVFAASAEKNALLFVKGNTREEALQNNERVSARTPGPLAVSELLPSDKARAENVSRWKRFWSAARRHYARLLVEEESAKLGLNSSAFAPFWAQTAAEPADDSFDFTEIYNPVAALENGSFAVVNVVPNTPEYEAAAAETGAVFVSADGLKKELVSSVKKEALQIVLLALAFNLIAVWRAFKSWRTALLTFVPVFCAACFTFGCFWAFGVQVNLFILVFLPLLMGLGIDYGIFQVLKYASGPGGGAYPASALLTAALSTLAGFGVLAFARHGVLYIMGLSSFLGVGGAMLSSLFILPAFLEKK